MKDTFKAEWTTPDTTTIDDSYALERSHLQINLVSPPANDRYRITAAGKFPAIKATAQVVNVDPDPTQTTQFTWTEKLSVKKGTGETVSYANQLKQSQQTTGTGEYDLHRKDDTVLVGGDLELDISATVNGHTLTGATSGVTIVGTNPQRADVQSRIAATVPTLTWDGLHVSDVTDVIERIACQETAQRQFKAAANGGVGPAWISFDNGAGIFQLTDPSPFDDSNLIFDWRANTDGGLTSFRSKIPVAKRYPALLRASGPYKTEIGAINVARASAHLSPITITPAPDFTMIGMLGATPTDQLLDDATRGYNGYAGSRLYGQLLHEFKPNVPYLKQLPDSQLPGLGTDPNVWVRVDAGDRGSAGDPTYVSDVTAKTPQCGG